MTTILKFPTDVSDTLMALSTSELCWLVNQIRRTPAYTQLSDVERVQYIAALAVESRGEVGRQASVLEFPRGC